jgi:LacI family transcriptional regulator
MEDVAIAARVSLKTVSRVVNGEPGVAPGPEQRVRDVIEALGFRRNDSARLLRTGRRRPQDSCWRTSATLFTPRWPAAWRALPVRGSLLLSRYSDADPATERGAVRPSSSGRTGSRSAAQT